MRHPCFYLIVVNRIEATTNNFRESCRSKKGKGDDPCRNRFYLKDKKNGENPQEIGNVSKKIIDKTIEMSEINRVNSKPCNRKRRFVGVKTVKISSMKILLILCRLFYWLLPFCGQTERQGSKVGSREGLLLKRTGYSLHSRQTKISSQTSNLPLK